MNSVRKILASGLGTGYLPLAPGTWASAVVVGIFAAVALATEGNVYWLAAAMAAVLAVASAACVALGGFAERAWGGKDPKKCTLDEWAGQALALLALPMAKWDYGWAAPAAAAFIAFRVFDILKPPPSLRLEKLPRGWGILADDLIAGLYANALCQLVVRFPIG